MRALPFALALLAASVAFAEPVTYHLTGTVDMVDAGGPGSLDLTGTFTLGTTFMLDLTVERSTVPSHPDAWTYIYNVGKNAHFTIGSYACTGAGGAAVNIENDYYGFDEFDFFMYVLTAPPVGTATPQVFQLTLQNNAGNVLDSGALPRPMPDMSNWPTRFFTLSFSDGVNTGAVGGTLTDVATPVLATTWGGIKDLYRQ
jgi:hypothetical protein